MSNILTPFLNAVSRSVGDMVRLLAGERLAVTRYGAKPDGVIVFDGAINASSKTFTSATMATSGVNSRAPEVGKVVWIEGAGLAGVDLLTTVASINSPSSFEIATAASISVSNAESRFGTDNTTFIEKALGSIAVVWGRRLTFPAGIYLTVASSILRSHVMMTGDGWGYDAYNANSPSTIACCANVPVFTNTALVTGDGWVGGNIKHLSFRGTSRTGSKGIYSELTLGLYLEYCAFDYFGDQAVHLAGTGIFGIHIIGCSATNSCLVRTGRTDYVGVFDIRPSDIFMSRCEVSASTSNDAGGEYGSGFIAAFRIAGTNSFIDHCMGHHSQIGFYVGPITTPQVTTTFVNCRADQNQGHGWVIDAYHCHFLGCRSHMNYLDAHGTYDAYHVINGNHTFTACEGTSAGNHTGTGDPHNNLYRDVFHFNVNSFFPPSTLNMCPIGDTFTLDRAAVCTRDIYHVEGTTRQPIIIDYQRYAPTDTYEMVQNVPINMKTKSLWMEAGAGAANTRQWSMSLGIPGLDNAFNIAAWNDARSTFVFPLVIVRNQTTGAISYISFRDAAFALFDGSLSFVEFDALGLFKAGVTYQRDACHTDERRWSLGPSGSSTAGTGEFHGAAENDAVNMATIWLSVLRTGTTIDSISLNGAAINLNGNVVIHDGNYIQFNNNTCKIFSGSGSPEGVVTAVGASIFLDAPNGAVYFKIHGSGNTGWEKASTLDTSGLTVGPLRWDGSVIVTGAIDLSTSDRTGTLDIGHGGTGQTTAAAALAALGGIAAANVYDKTASDARYYTQAQVDAAIAAAVAGLATTSYVDAQDGGLQSQIDSAVATHNSDVTTIDLDLTSIHSELGGMIHP